MGKTKELLQQMNEANQMIDDSYQYNEWLQSDEFVEYVNRQLDTTKLQYSESDIMNATRYASKSIVIDPSEVGKQVYDMLFSEKIEEYLHTQRI